MPVTMQQVRKALDPDEPDYDKAAELGPQALPHLETLIEGDDIGLASKAASLAGRIRDERSVAVLDKAASHGDARVRVAAAAAARGLPAAGASEVLSRLVTDRDVGVQKHALRSVPTRATPELRQKIESLKGRRGAAPLDGLIDETLSRVQAG
jgi:HEAT repeat protein